tara:strand:- start:728 stop:1615 length:888 start_codon:yes stop_codon:yes gene_type:complete
MKIKYKYPDCNLIVSNIKIKKKIIHHGPDYPIKLFIIEINNKLYVLKIKDKKYIMWNKDKLHNNKKFINIYKYTIENLDKSLLKYLYKIFYTFQTNNKFFHIMEKYDYDLDYDFFEKNHSKNVLKNLLVKIQIILFYLNNKLLIYHNDIVNGNKYHIRNIMYNKRKIKHKKIVKYKLLNNLSVDIYDDVVEPIMIDLDNASKNTPYFKRTNHFNEVFDNKINYMSEVIIFTYYYLIMIKNNKIVSAKIRFNNRIFLQKKIIKLYNLLKKYKYPINIDAYFIKMINQKYFDEWNKK